MTDVQFRAFLNLMMCSDPWPASEQDHEAMEAMAIEESNKRGFDSWYVAFHEFKL